MSSVGGDTQVNPLIKAVKVRNLVNSPSPVLKTRYFNEQAPAGHFLGMMIE